MGPPDTWYRVYDWLRHASELVGSTPKAVLVISGHWEEEPLAVTSNPAPPLLYDYYGFPEHTYQLKYPAPGSPVLAQRIGELLAEAGFAVKNDTVRGFDHGVSHPLQADLSGCGCSDRPTLIACGPECRRSHPYGSRAGASPARGRADRRKRHELSQPASIRTCRGPGIGPFDEWLTSAVCATDPQRRNDSLRAWKQAPGRATGASARRTSAAADGGRRSG